jgi:FixJ family two-component response regulator
VSLAQDEERRKFERSISELRRMYESLTSREREVTALVASGLMNKHITA